MRSVVATSADHRLAPRPGAGAAMAGASLPVASTPAPTPAPEPARPAVGSRFAVRRGDTAPAPTRPAGGAGPAVRLRSAVARWRSEAPGGSVGLTGLVLQVLAMVVLAMLALGLAGTPARAAEEDAVG